MKPKELEWTDQQKKDFLTTYEFWCWAAETGKMKAEWPEFERIWSLDGECAFCHYFGVEDAESYCPLKKKTYCNNCHPLECANGLYEKWCIAIESENISCAKTYAKYIRNRIRKYLIREGVLNET